MERKAMLTSYAKCDGCGKCVEACIRAHGCAPEQSGVKLSVSGPFTFPSGKVETYYVATPTDFCDQCVGNAGGAACAAVCPFGCIEVGDVSALGEKLTEKKMALFTLRG